MKLGQTVYFKGDPYTVSSAPYELYGGQWVDATASRTVTVPTTTVEIE